MISWPRRALGWRAFLFVALALSFAVRAQLALRPIDALDGLTLPDDAYLCLHLARSIAHGQGPWYGAAHTNGFQPLFVLLMVPAFFVFHDPLGPVRAALFLGAIADTAALGFLLAFVRRVTGSVAACAVLAALWVFSSASVMMALDGMETSLAVAAVAALFLCADEATTPRRAFAVGALGGLAVLARIDAVLAAGALVAWHVGRASLRGTLRDGLRRIAPPLVAGAAVVYLPWMIYSLRYTGLLYPVSGRAVRFLTIGAGPPTRAFLRQMIDEGAQAVWKNGARAIELAGALAAASLVAAFRDPRGLARRLAALAPMLAWGAALFAAYTLHVLAPWFFPRYLFPCLVPFVVGAALLAQFLASLLPRRAAAPALFALALALGVVGARDPTLAYLRVRKNDHDTGYMELGLWAAKRFPPGTVVGGVQSGALGYFADRLRVINLDGVVNADCYRAMVERKIGAYLRREKVAWVIGWQINVQVLLQSAPDLKPGDLAFDGLAPGFRSWGAPWEIWRVRE